LPTVASLAPAERNYARRALISDFPGLAIRGWRLAISEGLRPVAFCDVVEAGNLPMLSRKGKTLVRQPDTTGAAPNNSGPSLLDGYVRGDFRCT